MQSFKELAQRTRAETRAKEHNRVLESQWQLQNVAAYTLGLALGLYVHARARRGNWPQVIACEMPADWRPVDPMIAAEYGSPLGGDYLRHKRREARARAAAIEAKRTHGDGAVLDTLATERFMKALTMDDVANAKGGGGMLGGIARGMGYGRKGKA